MRIPLLLALMIATFSVIPCFGQGATTATITGFVSDENSNAMGNANIIAIHLPTGTEYGTSSRQNGQYTLPNVRVGGPYELTVTYVGAEEEKIDNVYLSLGQELKVDFSLQQEAIQMDEIVISYDKGSVLNSDRTGTESNITEEVLKTVPTIERQISDFVKLTPQANTNGDGISIAGMNNRYNSIFIDGAVNNDVFGLSDSGTNGGQTGVSPISVDAIEEFQVVLSPYDVKYGGFAGGGINAVTRSGTNQVEGSVYALMRNENLVGRTHPLVVDRDGEMTAEELDEAREKVDPFNALTTGVRIGAPLKKNKAFIFFNAEIQREQTPNPFTFSNYNGDATQAQIEALRQDLINRFGYDPGTFLDNEDELKGEKFLVRLDYNLSQKHKLTARHSYTRGRSFSPSTSSSSAIRFANGGVYFPSTTNSSAVELNSVFGSSASNNLIVGFTRVFDDRDPLEDPFPYVLIEDGGGEIVFGSERFSTANQLAQNIFTLTNNYNMYRGRHTITLGTHNEFYDIYNLFIRENFGVYEYASLNDFLTDANPIDYARSYSLVDDLTGDGSGAAANFQAAQLGFYAQDKISVSERFSLTAGLRIDLPFFLTQQQEDTYFNETTIPMIESYGYDMGDARAGQMPSTSLYFSPRLGFNYDVSGNRNTQIRGGAGIFTSRVPFVWPGGSYTNNGLTIGGTDQGDPDISFEPDPSNNPTAADFGEQDAIPSGQMDLFVKNYKYPQIARASLAVDQNLFWGMTATIEGMYSKTLNNVIYENVNLKPSTETLTGPDQRPLYDRGDEIDPTYGRIMLGQNTNEGYSYNVTAMVNKPFRNGLALSLAYTYGEAKAMNDGTSSQNSSQWRYVEQSAGLNNLALGYSDFDLGSRVIGNLSYRIDYANNLATTISLNYVGQSGKRFSYIYDGRIANDDSGSADLIYVPADQSEINLIQYTGSDGNIVTANDQWSALDAYINDDPYLSEHRGQIVERNSNRLPFTNNIDLRIAQELNFKAGKDVHRLEAALDILNFTNLLNKNWGAQYFTRNDQFQLISYEGTEEGTNNPQYTFQTPETVGDVSDFISRWRMQVSVRYIFNK